MASIRKRGDRWHVQIRRKGRSSVTRSFLLKTDAQAWARQQELQADRHGLPTDHKSLKGVTVADVLTRYRDEVVPRKRGADRETLTINAFLRRPLARMAVGDLTSGAVSAYCTERLKRIKPSTMNRELDVLRHAFFVARKSWDIPILENVFATATRPKQAPPRERRLAPGERERLKQACMQCRNPFIRFLVELAIETGMRRGELLRARWSDLSLERRTLHIPIAKNGHARTIPLSSGALAILSEVKAQRLSSHYVLPITEDMVKMAWRRIVKRAGIVNLRFHDLRHEAISSFFERGLSVPEVALISGHRDPRMLFRYTHPNPELIATKLV